MRAIAPRIEMVCAECAAARQATGIRQAARVHRRGDLLTRLPALFQKVREIVAHEWGQQPKRVDRGR